MAKWPYLILPQFCKTEIHVFVESEDIEKDGGSIVLVDWNGKCNYQDKAKRIYTTDKEYIEVTGCCLIPGDIAPNLDIITSGTVKIFKGTREIALGTKARNPDGTVNYTRLDLK
ncbi:MAG: hypothetical protein RR585_10430 [Coprobacillus sp.]